MNDERHPESFIEARDALSRTWNWTILALLGSFQLMEANYMWGYFASSDLESMVLTVSIVLILVTLGHMVGVRVAGSGTPGPRDDMDRDRPGLRLPLAVAAGTVLAVSALKAVSFCASLNLGQIYAVAISVILAAMNMGVFYGAYLFTNTKHKPCNHPAPAEDTPQGQKAHHTNHRRQQ